MWWSQKKEWLNDGIFFFICDPHCFCHCRCKIIHQFRLNKFYEVVWKAESTKHSKKILLWKEIYDHFHHHKIWKYKQAEKQHNDKMMVMAWMKGIKVARLMAEHLMVDNLNGQ